LLISPINNGYRFAESLGRSCPLILCGLAVAIAFRAQAWNIGVEGQYLMGAIAATAIGVHGGAHPGWLLFMVMALASIIAGAIFAIPAALLETRRGVPLVLSTILLNFIAVSLVSYLTQGPLRGSDPSAAQSDPIARQAFLPSIVTSTDFHWGWPVAIVIALLLWLLINWTTIGFELRVVGLNPIAARWSGMSVPKIKILVMCLSGGIAGLAGGIQIAGVSHLLNIQASEGFGYVAIAVALLARLNPLGTVVAGIFIAMLDIGAAHIERQPALAIPSDLAQVIKGMMVLCVLILSSTKVVRKMTFPGTRVPVLTSETIA
jgi:simple sugar transport system permease protein